MVYPRYLPLPVFRGLSRKRPQNCEKGVESVVEDVLAAAIPQLAERLPMVRMG